MDKKTSLQLGEDNIFLKTWPKKYINLKANTIIENPLWKICGYI